MIEDLLNLAEDLAAGTKAGRPRSVSLRRAASTAYYAVFHALARLCADELVGWSKPWPVVTPVYRSLDHRRAREMLNAIRRQQAGSPISQVATAFVELQDARHDADYNPEPFRLNRTATVELVGAARQAVRTLDSLPSDEKLRLAVHLITRPR